MNKREVVTLIEGAIHKYGFEIGDPDLYLLPTVVTKKNPRRERCVMFSNEVVQEIDNENRIITAWISLVASTCRMGEESVDSLLCAADELKRAAELVDEINSQSLEYIENF